MAEIKAYRKKPVVIQAIYYDGDNTGDIKELMPVAETEVFMVDQIAFKVHTNHGPVWLYPGNWLIKQPSGELYPCDPETFTNSYEEA